METPLDAREFLKRFHLPQLVRISAQDIASLSGQELPVKSREPTEDVRPNRRSSSHQNEVKLSSISGRPDSPAGNSNTSISSSFVALSSPSAAAGGSNRVDKPSHWTYSEGCGRSKSGARSLTDAFRQERESTEVSDQSDDQLAADRFCSISAWSSQQVTQMMEREPPLVRVPRASLVGQPKGRQPAGNRWSQLPVAQQEQPAKRRTNSVEFREAGGSGGRAKGEDLIGRQQQQREQVNHQQPAAESIRLAPPSRRPQLSRLQLDQPFLLYKAHSKLELTAYILDPKNELTDKSGDPIYFPQNYPGWFSIRDTDPNCREQSGASSSDNRPLETIDQVCRHQAQVFLTRDELIGYQLPRKLSHLTKLKNNQLLALPLAINLNRSSPIAQQQQQNRSPSTEATAAASSITAAASGQERKRTASGGSAKGESISDIRQVVIKSGQVLRVCGVYEDVLPLIEGKQQQLQKQQSDHRRRQESANNHHNLMATKGLMQPQANFNGNHYQAANIYSYQPQQQQAQPQQQQQYQSQAADLQQAAQVQASGQRKGGRRLLRLRNPSRQVDFRSPLSQQQPRGSIHYDAPTVGFNQLPAAAAQVKPSNSKRGTREQVASSSSFVIGQRYARCVLLSQSSVDRLTDCATPQLNPSDINETVDEIEVLIPIEQRGRFYLCATDQSLMNEFTCYLCLHSASRASNLVFRLSQIIHLLSLSRRLIQKELAAGQQHQLLHNQHSRLQQQPYGDYQQQQRARASCLGPVLRLPLTVRLVLGPRPANFSPSMFGSSSSVDSYFQSEANVAGHSIRCHFNKGFVAATSGQQQPTSGSSSSSVVCPCAQRLDAFEADSSSSSESSFGSFSASLLIEQVNRREVLLACTIKSNPLVHLDLNRSPQDEPLDLLPGKLQNNNIISGFSKESCAGRLLSNRKLLALREDQPAANDQLQVLRCSLERQATQSKASGKSSSFSRLRACRSLISLNGRRNKKRPNIPNHMLPAKELIRSDSSQDFNNGLRANETSSASHSLAKLTGDKSIVLVEFDCNERRLHFVRTFVESSIPSSNIPDLVLRRMDFCHRNSGAWERQLKLSYASLSRDFDSCRRQLELSRRRLVADRLAASSTGRPLYLAPSGEQQPPTSGSITCPSSGSASSSSSSTASSSRSSSGVSSAGDRHKSLVDHVADERDPNRKLRLQRRPQATLLSSGSAASSSSLPGTGTGTETGAASTSPANEDRKLSREPVESPRTNSRLLRIVHRILLPSGSSDADCNRQRKRQLPESGSGHEALVMNSQLIHKRLLERNLPESCARDELTSSHLNDDDATVKANSKGSRVSSVSFSAAGSEGYEEEAATTCDSGSHLYESLERLHLATKSLAPASSGGNFRRPAAAQFGHKSLGCGPADSSKSTSRGAGLSRSHLGKSIEWLAAGGVRASSNSDSSGTSGGDDDDEEDDGGGWWPIERPAGFGQPEVLKPRRQLQRAPPLEAASRRRLNGRHWPLVTRPRSLVVSRAQPEVESGPDAMEPVSIEHEVDDFVSMVCDDSEQRYNQQPEVSSAGRLSPSEEELGAAISGGEAVYVNLSAANEGDSKRRAPSRMERKLMRIRGGRRQGSGGALSPSLGNLPSSSESNLVSKRVDWHNLRPASPGHGSASLLLFDQHRRNGGGSDATDQIPQHSMPPNGSDGHDSISSPGSQIRKSPSHHSVAPIKFTGHGSSGTKRTTDGSYNLSATDSISSGGSQWSAATSASGCSLLSLEGSYNEESNQVAGGKQKGAIRPQKQGLSTLDNKVPSISDHGHRKQ